MTTVSRGERRRARAAAARAAVERAERRRRRLSWAAGAVAVLAVFGVVAVLASGGEDGPAGASRPVVGGDLHTVTAVGDALFVGGHAAVAVSRDGGRRWQEVPSLNGADAMGWAVTTDSVLVGGHPGLYRSADGGETFVQVPGEAAVPDVHALGGVGKTVYLASPQAGVLASTDGGRSWQGRNANAGQSLMGTILVDPRNPERLIAPDMARGLVISTDGGRTFQQLGGPMGAMAAAWNPKNLDEIIVVGMEGAARSTDAGTTWQEIEVPQGTSAVTYAEDGRSVYAGALEGQNAVTYRSTDGGLTWTATG